MSLPITLPILPTSMCLQKMVKIIYGNSVTASVSYGRKTFIQLTREDFSIIFPKFLLSSKLFKFAQRIHSITEGSSRDTASLLADMSDLECPLQSASSGLSSGSSSRCSTPFSEGRKRSMDASAVLSKRKCGESGFKLPQFSPDLKLCIKAIPI